MEQAERIETIRQNFVAGREIAPAEIGFLLDLLRDRRITGNHVTPSTPPCSSDFSPANEGGSRSEATTGNASEEKENQRCTPLQKRGVANEGTSKRKSSKNAGIYNINTLRGDCKGEIARKCNLPEDLENAKRLAILLAKYILKNNPQHTTLTTRYEDQVNLWVDPIEKLIRIDRVQVPTIEKIIRFCQKDPFWRNNILSGKKLREQFNQLMVKMIASEGGAATTTKPQITGAALPEPGSALAQIEKWEREMASQEKTN